MKSIKKDLENKNFSLCQKWQKVTYSYSEFKNKIDEYTRVIENEQEGEEEYVEYQKTTLDKFVEFYTNYYYILLIILIIYL